MFVKRDVSFKNKRALPRMPKPRPGGVSFDQKKLLPGMPQTSSEWRVSNKTTPARNAPHRRPNGISNDNPSRTGFLTGFVLIPVFFPWFGLSRPVEKKRETNKTPIENKCLSRLGFDNV